MKKFVCVKCGICCRSLYESSLYSDLNRGDGRCKYLDEITNLCSIYETRPDKCNVQTGYQYFEGIMCVEEYIECNVKACVKLTQ